MAEGNYASINRRLIESDLWLTEKFTRGQAWVDLILMANYKAGHFRVRGIRVDINRGQIGRSSLTLSERWKWSRGKVGRFLNELEKEQQIVQQKTRLTTLITIVNYDKYQGDSTTNDTTDGQQTVQQTNIYNNNNNNNKVNLLPPEAVPKTKYRFEDDDLRLASVIKNKVMEVVPTLSVNNMESWANDIRLARERDGRTRKELHEVFLWANGDSFWRGNILSPSKLRKQFDVLASKANKKQSPVHSGLTTKNYAEGSDGFNN